MAVGDRSQRLAHPHAAENDVIVEVHAAGFTLGELDWPATWTDRAGRDRTPSVPGHELSGVVTELGYGTTGLTVGQRVFGLTDWSRNGSLAQYTAVEARNLAPLPADVDHVTAAALPISGLTAWQALFDHAHLITGQSVLIHGAAGGVGSIAVQLAREARRAMPSSHSTASSSSAGSCRLLRQATAYTSATASCAAASLARRRQHAITRRKVCRNNRSSRSLRSSAFMPSNVHHAPMPYGSLSPTEDSGVWPATP
ncbi:NADP-dependent oxidoreductase [Streptomyces sp. NPDC020747]|uniref:NADP-dependent oxidoreductase n=1 Tax=Streptomyces sp. NPDC020747 TaxID=3365086 RepID=UPI0037AE5264